jgi:hypothetical protein
MNMSQTPHPHLLALVGWLALGTAAFAQTADSPQAADPSPQSPSKPLSAGATPDELITLSPFEVKANTDVGYQARETLAGSRTRMSLKDISSQVDVMTEEFLSDLGITSLEDSLKYSLSVESQTEWYDPSGSENTLGGNPFNPSAGNRARGLARASISVGFFETSAPVDNYSTERLTFVGGPNAILFGNGLAGGSIDTSFKRARTNRDKYSLSLQVDTEEGYRSTIDINKVLIKDYLALRYAGVKQDVAAGRAPSYDRSERSFGALTFQPSKKINVRAYYEGGTIHRSPVRSTLVQDKVTPYLNRILTPEQKAKYLSTYDPSVLTGFDNSAINSFNISANTNAMVAALRAQGLALPVPTTPVSTDIAGRFGSSSPVLVLGGIETSPIPIMSWNNTAALLSTPGQFNGENNDWSFTDGSVYPTQMNIVGNALQQRTRTRTYGGAIELNPVKDLFIEYAVNREAVTYNYREVLGAGNTELGIDLNRYLPAQWVTGQPVPTRVLNPNFGRYYVQSAVAGGDNQQEKSDNRLTATYTVDFTKKKGWARWLGTHRLLGLWTSQMSQRFEQVRSNASAANVVSDNDFTVSINNSVASPLPPALVSIQGQANRFLQVRNYLGSPTAGVGGTPYVDMQIDPWNWGTMGVDSSGKPVVVASDDLPGGGNAWGISNGRKETRGEMFSIASSFLKNRLILSYGHRVDTNSYTNWLPNNLQPRYDASTGQFVIPTAPVSATNLPHLQTAPYMTWQNFKKLGLEKMQDLASRQNEKPKSILKGIVVHPLDWLSFFYNDSSSAYAAEFSRFNHDGSSMAIDDGFGKDYGFSVSTPDAKYSVRVNWFESTRNGGNSIFQGQIANGMRSLRDTVYYVEKTFLLVNPGFDVDGNQYAYYLKSVRDSSFPSSINTTSTVLIHGSGAPVAPQRETSAVQADRRAEGVEVSLTANPLAGLSLSIKAAKNTTKDSNAGLTWFEYMDARWTDWESIANTPFGNIAGMPATIKQYMQSIILPTMSYMKLSDGMPNPQERKYRVNFTARYALQGGPLKGLYFGGNYNWRSKSILAYATRPVEAGEVYREFAGIGAGGYDVPDFNTPVYGRPLTTIDGFLGYKRKIFRNRYEWSIQLNIRNLLDDDDLLEQRAFAKKQPDGTTVFWITHYNVPDPRRFTLTNTISF